VSESRITDQRREAVDLGSVSRFLGILTLAALALGAVLLAILAVPAGRRRVAREVEGAEQVLLSLAAVVALMATTGSLYFSEVVGFTPCLLCWYQRIAMYPLVPVLGVAAVARDREVGRYALPLSVAGLLVATYHVAIQFRPTLDVVTCTSEAPCTARYLAVFGFISIPVMASGAFLLVTALLIALRSGGRTEPPPGPPAPGAPS
jgi:disulfide bond formation protein DsbB